MIKEVFTFKEDCILGRYVGLVDKVKLHLGWVQPPGRYQLF